MANILLLDSNEKHRIRIALSLRAQGHQVLLVENYINPLSMSNLKISEIDVVLAETIDADEALWKQLEYICKLRRKDGLPPLIVCSSRI